MLFTIREYRFINGDRSIVVIEERDSSEGFHTRKPVLQKIFKTNWNVDDKIKRKRLREYDEFVAVMHDIRKARLAATSENDELREWAELKMAYSNVFFRREKNWIESDDK